MQYSQYTKLPLTGPAAQLMGIAAAKCRGGNPAQPSPGMPSQPHRASRAAILALVGLFAAVLLARMMETVTQPESLLDLAMDQIALHAGVPWIAMYEYTPDGYSRVRQLGTQDLPPQVAADDLALVKLRAHDPEVNLHEAPSAIGRDGYAFPMRARGHLLGVLVVGPRPGEHSVAEERELLAHVAHEVGAALFALRAEASEAQLRELHAREKTLLEALRAFVATTTP